MYDIAYWLVLNSGKGLLSEEVGSCSASVGFFSDVCNVINKL